MRGKKQKPARGAVVAIPLADGGFGYGRMLDASYVELREVYSDEPDVSPEAVVSSPILTTVFVSPYDTHEWIQIGVVAPSEEVLSTRLEYHRQDSSSGQMSVFWKSLEPSGWGEEPSTLDRCAHLEPAVVWSAGAHASRLSDLRAGRPPMVLKRHAIDPEAARSFEAGQPRRPRSPGALFGWNRDSASPSVADADAAGTATAEEGLRAAPFTDMMKMDGKSCLILPCGGLPADAAVIAAQHEPSGYFWEGALTVAAPDVAGELELDSEAGAFVAYGPKEALRAAQEVVERLAGSARDVEALIAHADAEGFVFED